MIISTVFIIMTIIITTIIFKLLLWICEKTKPKALNR